MQYINLIIKLFQLVFGRHLLRQKELSLAQMPPFILPNVTTFTQLNLFLKSIPYQGHAMYRGWTISPCIG